MLVIRPQQVKAFEPVARQCFETRALAHLRRVLPEQCEALGKPAVRGRIRQGIEKAEGWGIRSEYDVIRFIDLMFLLALDFDASADYPWCRRTLMLKALSPTEKLDKLYEQADVELKKRPPAPAK